MCLKRCNLITELVGQKVIVAIEVLDKLTVSSKPASFAGESGPTIGLTKYDNLFRMRGLKLRQNLGSVIGRAVIDEDHLCNPRRVEHPYEELSHGALLVEARNDDRQALRDFRHRRSLGDVRPKVPVDQALRPSPARTP